MPGTMDSTNLEHGRSKAAVRVGSANTGRPRLMYVLGLAPQKIGGMEKFLRHFVLALTAVGWDAVLCFDGPIADEFRDYIGSPHVVIESLDRQGQLGFACAGELWKLLRKHRPRVFVYAFNGVMRCFPILAKLAGCQRVFFNDHSSRSRGFKAAPLSLGKRLIGRTLTAPLDAIVSVSEFTKTTGNSLRVTSAPNIVVQNGVPILEKSSQRCAEFKKKYDIPGEAIVVTQVGWMVDNKGVEITLRAASSLLPKYAGLHFLLVGEGAELPRFKKLAYELGIESGVTFTGLISDPAAAGVYDATDIYCQPSIWQEACPLAVLEATSFKVPVVASNTGGLPEIVHDRVSGILFPVGQSDALSAAIEELLASPELRQRMGETGYQRILQYHRIEDTALRYVHILTGTRS